MQLDSVRKRKTASGSPHAPQGWTFSWWTALLFGFVMLVLVGSLSVYLAWDYMPARVRYIPRYVQATFLPARPHTAFVPTPEVALDPEQALQRLAFPEPANEAPEATPAEEPVAQAVEEPVAVPEAVPSDAVAGEVENNTAVVEEEAATVGVVASDNVAVAEDAVVTEEVVAAEAVADPLPTAVPTIVPLYQAPGPAAQLTDIRHEYQGWNNCGPATLAMNLSYFGRPETQAETAPVLKPDEDDKNVSPGEMAAYAESIGLHTQVVVGMDLEMLRTFVANGLPVIVESWYIPEPDDEMGHYLLLTGYEGETLTFHDSYNGPNIKENAAEFDELWKVFNRTAIVLWSPEKDAVARAILGDLVDPQVMYERALTTAHEEVKQNPRDRYAWFNLGSSFVALGDTARAVEAFDTARSLELPWRMLWYQFTPYEAYFAEGQYEEVKGLATTTLESAGNLEESFYWRGRAEAALGEIDAARRDFQQAIRFNPNFAPAHEALAQLP